MDTSMMVTPNIAGMATAMAANKTSNEVGVAMLAKSIDSMEANGAALTKMMELSVNPAIGGNFDMSV